MTEKSPKAKLPLMTFSGLVISLHASALTYLGAMPGPEGDGVDKDMSLARQTIDMLRVIDEKTRGNLTPDEKMLLHKLLLDLQVAYAKAAQDG